MFDELKAAFLRSRATLAQDLAGVLALAAILVVALHLPQLG